MTQIRKKVILCIVLVTCGFGSYSQGGWDINYISLSELNTSYIGKEVRIDFKASKFDTIKGPVNVLAIRKLLAKKDTVSLRIDYDSVDFIEHWKLYVDHGVLVDQYLESVTTGVKKKVYIKGMFLESINDDSLVLQAILSNRERKGEMNQRIVISKSIIKGLLISSSE